MLDIIYEDNHCLALNKPAGLLTQGDHTGVPALIDLARDDLKIRYRKPGNVFLGLVHRIDQPTSGAVLFARTSKAAARLSEQFRSGSIDKVYWAIVEGNCPDETGAWSDVLLKDETRNIVEIVPVGTPGGRSAEVEFRVIERGPGTTMVELRPRTGRSHQLRVQLASRGFPIMGDLKYGATRRLPAADGQSRIALHARSLRFNHPTRPEAIELVAAVPADWPASEPVTRSSNGSSTPGGRPAPP